MWAPKLKTIHIAQVKPSISVAHVLPEGYEDTASGMAMGKPHMNYLDTTTSGSVIIWNPDWHINNMRWKHLSFST